MFTIARLAVRNVFRNKSRSGLTCLALAFGVFMTMLLGGFVYGLTNIMIFEVVNGRTGALQVHRRGYDNVKDNFPLDYDMPYGGDLEAKILATAGVRAASGRIVFAGSATNGTRATFVVANAHDPAREYVVCKTGKRGLEGEGLTAGNDSKGVLGFELAEALDAKAGATMVVQAATRDGQQNALDLEVGGTVNNALPLESKRMIYVPLAMAQSLLKLEGRVTEYAIAIDDVDRVDAVAADLSARLGADYHVQTWKELRPQLVDIVVMQRTILLAVCLVFLVIAVFGVVNTMLMAVLERTREIGTMMAVGIRRARITALFLAEAAALALIGTAAGTIGGYAFNALLIGGLGGITVSPPGSKSTIKLVPEVPGWIVAATVAVTAAAAVIAAVYPAWKASRLRPVEALRAT